MKAEKYAEKSELGKIQTMEEDLEAAKKTAELAAFCIEVCP